MKGMNGILVAEQLPVFHYANSNPKFGAEKVCAENERYLVHFDGILWHFYCAVRPTVTEEEKRLFGHEYRCLTAARSKPF